ncbi:1680_t:CDS:2, partial [Funneliformis geosporum]
EPKTDQEIVRKWENERTHKQEHIHQPTINETVSGTIGIVGTGTISGGTFGVEISKKRDQEDYHEELQRKQARIDGENLQPIYNIQIPPPRVVTPSHPPQTPEYQIFSSSSIVSPTTRSEITFDERGKDNPYMFQEKNISALFILYRLKAWQMARESGLSIETDYPDNFSDLQIGQFSGDTLVDFHKHMRNTYIVKTKVAQCVKMIFRECIETALDEDLGLKEAERSVERSFTKSFDNPLTRKSLKGCGLSFYSCKTKNIPVKLLKDLLSEGTLTANIISPVLRSFFHDASIHPAIWPNTASISSKICKLADLDPSRAKQPDMIRNVVNNNKSKYEIMFGEITGEGKNNNEKKNNLDLIRLGIFMKDALDLLIKKTGEDHMIFAWQTIMTIWTGYIMVLTASGLYIMFDTGETELPNDICCESQEKYENEVQRLRDYINKKKENGNVLVEIINRLRATLRTPQFKEIVKRK